MIFRRAAAKLLRRSSSATPFQNRSSIFLPNAVSGRVVCANREGFGGGDSWSRHPFKWIFLYAPAAIILGGKATVVMAEDVSPSTSTNDAIEAEIAGLQKIDDGSITSNIHTQKWRVYTDSARDLFLQGKLDGAERLFLAAIKEAKEGFGDRDSHVASACNNLAELYRVKKELGKAEPLYLEAISILEESFGQDDVRVGAALHNLGQFYLMQRNLEQAHICYEHALKIKKRVLGEAHPDYSDTMYHLGTVLHLQGKEKDSEALILESIRILEDIGRGESNICIKRMRYLAEMYLKSNRLAEAMGLQRKILHKMELSKGWGSLDTIIAAERLALTLQNLGSLTDALHLLERCLDARKTLLPEDHIEIAGNMLHIARLKMLSSNKLRKANVSQAITELDMAKDFLSNSIRVARKVLTQKVKEKGKQKFFGVPRQTGRESQIALMLLLQSLNALAMLEETKVELQESKVNNVTNGEAESALHECISAFREFEAEKSLVDVPQVKSVYVSCLKHLCSLISSDQSRKADLRQMKSEINRLEMELSAKARQRS